MSPIRPDRSITVGIVDPLLRAWGARRGAAIPVLMYHSVSRNASDSAHPYYAVTTSPERFAAQMDLLDGEGWRVVRLDDVPALLDARDGDDRCVAITFDDAYRNFLLNAQPVLERHGFPATVFLPTGSIADTAASFNGKECLTWPEIRDLLARGVSFGSHTVSHPQLWRLDASAIDEELARSRADMEDRLSCRVSSFSYPYAFPEHDRAFVASLREALRRNGYDVGVTTVIGRNTGETDRLFLRRLPVNDHDDPALFAAKLRGAYDWLHPLQLAVKKMKGVS